MTDKQRKETPIFSGVLRYFPDAMADVAKCSFAGQQQHNPDKPLAWDRDKLFARLMNKHKVIHSQRLLWKLSNTTLIKEINDK